MGPGLLLALALARRSPLVALALLVRERATGPAGTDGGRWSTPSRRVAGLVVARVLAPAVLAPLVLVGSLVGVLVVLVLGVLVLAGGITVAARTAGLG